MSRRAAIAVLGVLVALFVSLGMVQAARDAPTVDEAVEVAAGLSIIEHGDLRMNPEHGLLQRMVPAVLPAVVADPLVPRGEAWEDGDWFDYTDELISANDEDGRLDEVLLWYRVVPLLVGAATGLLLYALGARLLGRAAGLVAAGLWFTTPYVVGLAHLSSIDVTFTGAVVGVAVLLDRFRCDPSDRRLLALSLALGASLLIRHNAVVLLPIAVAVCLWERRSDGTRRRLVGVAIVGLVPLLVVWLAYRSVDLTAVGGLPRERFDAMIDSAAAEGPIEALSLAVPLPVEWRAGLAHLFHTSAPRPAYLFGDAYTASRVWFFPASALVKLPLTAHLLVAFGLWGWWRTDRPRRTRMAVCAGIPALVVAIFLVVQPLNLGLRLAMPVVALLFVVASGVVALPRRLAGSLIAVALLAHSLSMVAAHPTSLAWSPPPFTDGYRFVSDSSIDFGQANRSVREAHARAPFTAASLVAPRGYEVLPGVPAVSAVSPDELVGRIAVSATALAVTRADELGWLRAYCPVGVIDDAVLVYRFRESPNTSVEARGLPPAPCADGFSRVR